MKYLSVVSILIFMSLSVITHAQNNDSEDGKIDSLFTYKEQLYINKWFSEVREEMNLTKEVEEKYLKIFQESTRKMSELGVETTTSDSEEKLKKSFLSIVKEMNAQMETILNKDQYKIHSKSFDLVVWNTYLRKGWERD